MACFTQLPQVIPLMRIVVSILGEYAPRKIPPGLYTPGGMQGCIVIDMRTAIILILAALVVSGCNQQTSTPETHLGHDQHSDHGKSWTLEIEGGRFTNSRYMVGLKFKDESGQIRNDFEINHEKPLHLIAVSKDLGWYQHVHPKRQDDKSWTVDIIEPPKGEIIFFADFKPKGGDQQVIRATSDILGAMKTPGMDWTDRRSTVILDGVKATLSLAGNKVSLAHPEPLKFTVASDERKQIKLEPYLGAFGHLVIVDQSGEQYVHSHPASGSPDGNVTFEAHFPKAGLYRAWAEFQVDGNVRTFPFVIEVTS